MILLEAGRWMGSMSITIGSRLLICCPPQAGVARGTEGYISLLSP